MSLHLVKKVHLVTDNVRELNEYLASGWIIIQTAAGVYEDGSSSMSYSLGWAQDGAPVMPVRTW